MRVQLHRVDGDETGTQVWLDADEARGRKELGESASAVIADLKQIERQVAG
jgi:hypothetical protein